MLWHVRECGARCLLSHAFHVLFPCDSTGAQAGELQRVHSRTHAPQEDEEGVYGPEQDHQEAHHAGAQDAALDLVLVLAGLVRVFVIDIRPAE